MTPVWGRVPRGVVWHVLTGSHLAGEPSVRSWCGSVTEAEPVIEENDAQPPRGARACRRCCTAVEDYGWLVRAARVGDVDALVPIEQRTQSPDELETYGGRPIEDVDLIGAFDAVSSEVAR